MKEPDELLRENDVLRERLSRLSQASLRVKASLNFDTVWQQALDSARSVTGSRYGVIALHDDGVSPGEFLSAGMVADKRTGRGPCPAGHDYPDIGADSPVPCWFPTCRATLKPQGFPEMLTTDDRLAPEVTTVRSRSR